MTHIPKKAHIVWNHKEVINSNHPLITNGLHNLIKLNPDWEVTIYTPEEIETNLKQVLSEKDYNLVKNRHFVSKIDLWRLFKMYFEGGLYMDLDRMVNIPLSEVAPENINWVLPITKDYDLSCDFIMSAANNPAFKTAFEMYLTRLNTGWTDQYFLGPQTYMHAISYTLCGEIVNTDPGTEKFQMLRNKISEMPFIKTYREEPYNDMILYKGNEGDSLEDIKRDFYAKEKVKHWTGDW
jgi:mannosyltransferase OCH1-like enzyme